MMRSPWHRLLVTVLIVVIVGGAVAVATATAAADSAKVVFIQSSGLSGFGIPRPALLGFR
jgi:basic membrane lipoprotein Med (substrate-binding protein (PBP1-ABC) superfamily)